MELQSYYWTGAAVLPADREAIEQLASTDLPIEQRKAAFLRLLASESVVARGLALDFYSISTADLRHGNQPMIDEAIDEAVRKAALRELEAAPYQCLEHQAAQRRGANHASALTALSHNADPADAPLLARVLRESEEPRVLHEGVGVAEPVLRGEPAHPELVEVLSQIASRGDLDPRTRASAITAIGVTSDEAVTSLLFASAADPELAVSAAAARALLERDLERHRAFVAPIAAAWRTGESPPFDVHEVRRLLEGD